MISARSRFRLFLIILILFHVDIFYPTGKPILLHRLPRSLLVTYLSTHAFTRRIVAATYYILDS